MGPEVMTIRELADYLKLAPVTLYKMVNEGRIPCRRIGKSLRFPKAVIDQWLSRPDLQAEAAKAIPPEAKRFAKAVRGELGNRVKEIKLYGSWARGEARIDSDIDVAVIVDRKDILVTRTVSRISAEISLESDKLLSAIILEAGDHERGVREGYAFHRNIETEGLSIPV